jgi:hypothetical protein
MMYPELYHYLLQYRTLSLPGIGTFIVERKPAQADFPNKQLLPPVYSLAMQPSALIPPGKFFNWLGTALGISQMDAVIRFNDFVFEMKKQVDRGETINWSGVGIIKKGLGGEIKFQPYGPGVTEQPVPAVKILREKAEHTVRVGEEERTSVQMKEMLAKPDEKKSHWWAYALVTGLLAVIFIGWYFSLKGVDVASTANNKPLIPGNPPSAAYRVLP